MDVDVFVFRLLTALALGVAIGIERQMGQHPAGVRTNALVCLGSALFVGLSQTLTDKDGAARIAGQVVSGIGFLGGGAILREGVNVRGMNTAATLWCSAAIGTLVGAGEPGLAFLGTVAILMSHLLFRPIAHAIDHYTEGKGEAELLIAVKIVCQKAQEEPIRALLLEQLKKAKLRLQGVSIHDGQTECVEMVIHLFALQHKDQAMNDLIAYLAGKPGVASVSWGKAQ